MCGWTLPAAADAAFVTLALEVADAGALETQLRSSVASLGLSARIAPCEAGSVSGELACVRVSRSDLAFELLRVSGEVTRRDLDALDATRANVALRAQLTLRWRFVSRLSLVLEPCLELSPLEVRFGVQRASGFTPILELSALRPSASLGLYLEL